MSDDIKQINLKKNMKLLLTWFAAYIHKRGSVLKIENLSEYDGRLINFGVVLDKAKDSVTITCTEIKPENN